MKVQGRERGKVTKKPGREEIERMTESLIVRSK